MNIAPFAPYTTSTTDAASSSNIWLVDTWIFDGINQQAKTSYQILPVRTIGPPQIPAFPARGPTALALGIVLLGVVALAARRQRGRAPSL